MSCSSLKHLFDEQMRNGISFEKAMEIYQDVEGSLAAHRTEIADLQKSNELQQDIDHLREHITEGETLLRQIKSMKLH